MDGKTYEALLQERIEELQQFYDHLTQAGEQEKIVQRAKQFFNMMIEKGHSQDMLALYLPNPVLKRNKRTGQIFEDETGLKLLRTRFDKRR